MKTAVEALAIAILAIFAPIKAVLITVLILVIADLVSGLLIARKLKKPITSARLRDSLSKLIIYEVIIAIGFLAQTYLIGEFLPITKILAAMVGSVELKSILENADLLNGNPIFKTLIDKLGSPNKEDNETK